VADKVKLFAPKEYWLLSPEEKASRCNGCGTKGLGGWLVPDTLWGLSIEEVCNIHDFMYGEGMVQADKEAADRVFLNNMVRVINAKTRFGCLRALRLQRAMKYYTAVSVVGGPAFWHGKNKPEEEKET